MQPKHLLLDLDGTLWDTAQVSADAYNKALRKDGRSDRIITAETIRKEFGKSDQEIADDLFSEFPLPVRSQLMKLCDQANTTALCETDTQMLYSDIRSTLDALISQCSFYIVSNCGTGYIEMFLKKYHLESYITDMECCGNTGKPKWENIRLLMERNQISSVDAAYVGDTAGDSNSAAKAGIPFIFASYGYGAVDKKDLNIDHFADLLRLYK
ncbi:HAD family hydrolase [Clostridiaceae bacterium]|jgi:Predicted phosphatases|nr:HAD family hydrolase [Lachnospiraceae bacterium]NBH18853.1 HAD family hydrolase [Clostridiaceae bacterium]